MAETPTTTTVTTTATTANSDCGSKMDATTAIRMKDGRKRVKATTKKKKKKKKKKIDG